MLKENVASFTEETDCVQSWLNSEQAKEFVRHSPELKEVSFNATTAAKTLAKEQAAGLSAEESALGKIKSGLPHLRHVRRITSGFDADVILWRM